MRMQILIASFATLAVASAGTALAAGPKSPATPAPPAGAVVQPGQPDAQRFPYPGALHEVRGLIRTINANGTALTLQTRRGMLAVDAHWARSVSLIGPIWVPRSVVVHGVMVGNTLYAHDITHNDQQRVSAWPPDR